MVVFLGLDFEAQGTHRAVLCDFAGNMLHPSGSVFEAGAFPGRKLLKQIVGLATNFADAESKGPLLSDPDRRSGQLDCGRGARAALSVAQGF